MKILGKSRGVATVLGIAIGLAMVPVATRASAQLSPTGMPTTPPPPAGPAGHPSTPAAAKPNAPAAGTQPLAKPGAPGATAAAKPADPRALMTSGEKKFKAADYAGALADFEAANTAKASPEADRFIGQSHDNLGHFAEAAVAYERFLANVPAKMKAEGEETKKRVEAIKVMPGEVSVETTPPGAQILVDAAATTVPPPDAKRSPAKLDLAPGHHTLKLVADGYVSADKEIDVTFASKQDVRVELVKTEPAPPPPPPVVTETAATPPPAPPPEPRSKVPAYVTGAVAIVAAGVGTAFGVMALSDSSDFKKNPTTEKADDGENKALVADMMFGIAITFGVTSAVLFLSGDAPSAAAKANPVKTVSRPVVASAKPKSSVTITPTPFVTPTGGGAGALVRF